MGMERKASQKIWHWSWSLFQINTGGKGSTARGRSTGQGSSNAQVLPVRLSVGVGREEARERQVGGLAYVMGLVQRDGIWPSPSRLWTGHWKVLIRVLHGRIHVLWDTFAVWEINWRGSDWRKGSQWEPLAQFSSEMLRAGQRRDRTMQRREQV